jgi:hypothetical protein
MIGRLLIVCLCIGAAVHAADTPADSAVELARILAAKGTISAADLAAVTAASAADRVGALVSILQQKGLLTDTEVARFRPNAARPTVASAKPATPAPQIAELPVTTREHSAVSLYGTLLLNALYNTAATNIQDVPLFATKQGSDATGGDKNFGMTARQTRLGLRFQQDNVAGAKLTGQFEFDLFGGKTPLGNGMDMDLFRLRLAFGRLDWKHAAFEAGQDWSLFAPLNPTSLADFAIPEFSASGNPWIRLPQVRAEFKSAPSESTRLLWQIAALDPNMGDYPTATFSTSRQPGLGERGRMPSLESRLALTDRHADRDFTIGLSGHYGRGKNFGTLNGVTVFAPVDSWGIALDYSLPFSRFFTLTGEAFEGRALGIFSVTSGEAVGAVGGVGAHGVESRGGWMQGQFNPVKRWQVNLAYGIEVPNATQLAVGSRWRNQTYMGNLIYKLTTNVNFAWEYRRLITDYRNQPFATERGDHFNMAVGYIF